jgi:hypothetical protein
LPKAGKYEVRLYSTPNSNRATNVLVAVHSSEGDRSIRVDQRRPSPNGGPIVVGSFAFEAGASGWLEIRNDSADGYVIADAVQFVPEP